MSKYQVLFVENKQSEIDHMKDVFEQESIFQLVNNEPVCDVDSVRLLSREQHKIKIMELLEKKKFNIILFDLTLRDRTENNISPSKGDNFLSVEIYLELKNSGWLDEKNIKFVFVTSHTAWNEEMFYRIEGIEKTDIFIKKAEKRGQFVCCKELDENDVPSCKSIFQRCTPAHCFNMRLRRFIENG